MSQERVDNLFAGESWSAVYTAFSNISLKAYDFDTLREALLAYVQQTYPDKFNDFISSSEFIAILDLVAYLGHSLSFRLDMNTRENFLDVAERRESILRMAKNLGYIKTRPINSRGFMKITSVTTDQDISDNEGNSLAGTTVNWNDSNDVNWYENFITVLDAAFAKNSKIKDPIADMTVLGIENYLYEINESTTAKSVAYPFNTNIDGGSRRFESVRVEFEDDRIVEGEPLSSKNFTIVNRNDNLGAASDRTGFFVYAKAGELQFQNFTYDLKLSNRVETITTPNISNTDVWIQKIDTQGNYLSSVAVVDNDTRETAIYNSIRNGSGDLASVTTNIDNSIQIKYPDGIFGNAAYGTYRVWYRRTDNENFSVNSNDIPEVSITIPYVGSDGRTYRLILTMTSTRDFGENYSGETFESVRRIAPRSYYAQDRMVNGQDYNILPLTLGKSVVEKAKAVNVGFAGNSRYFEMDDVTGHHSNVSVTGTDGSVYIDDDPITMNLQFNREDGKSDDFIRNVMTEVIKHPSLINLYFYNNMFNPDAVNNTPNLNFDVRVTDTKIIEVTSSVTDGRVVLYPGDHILTEGTEELEETWVTITGYASTQTGQSIDAFTVSHIIPEMSGKIKKIVRGYRTRFEDTEIEAIKLEKIEDLSIDSFTIIYNPIQGTDKWIWEIYDETQGRELNDGEDVFITFTYKPGVRENEAEYVAKFTGKKVIFESTDQVKFFYSNNKFIVDNETNLTERDILLLNYYSTTVGGESTNTSQQTMKVNIGTTTLSNITQTNGTASFTADFSCTGANLTDDFVNNMDCYTPEPGAEHYLVSPLCIEYPIVPTAPSNTTVIGNSPNYTVSYNDIDISEIVGSVDSQVTSEATLTSTLYVTSDYQLDIESSADPNSGTITYYADLTNEELANGGFKGVPSNSYFSSQINKGAEQKFFWVDEDQLTNGNTLATAKPPMDGVQDSYIFTPGIDGSTDPYAWTFVGNNPLIDSADNDIYWKQVPYGEINFVHTGDVLTASNVLLQYNGSYISNNNHVEIIKTDNTYRIVFWTQPVNVGDTINVFIRSSGSVDLSDFTLRVERTVKSSDTVSTAIETYDEVESYIYDEFVTPQGYVDYSKVKLYASDLTRDPHGILKILANKDNTNIYGDVGDVSIIEFSHIVLESYNVNGKKYERVSDRVVAFDQNQNDEIPTTAIIRFLIEPTMTSINDGIWQKRVGGVWTSEFEYEEIKPGVILYDGITYRVVNGRSYIEDKFMSFRWDHFADEDKRIDPSTSNIVDLYVLSADYVRRVNTWVLNGFSEVIPQAPNSYELKKIMESIEPKAMISDHITYIPVKFKYLFGAYAEPENQAIFKVVKKAGTAYTDSEVKTAVSNAVNEFFDIDNWDFGETFYFSELASYIHKTLPNHIASVVITPKYQTSEFTNLLSISSEPTEIFLSVTTTEDVKIISNIVSDELVGE